SCRAQVLELGCRQAEVPADGVRDVGDAARVALRYRVAMVDSVGGRDYHLRTGVGEDRAQGVGGQLELGHELWERACAVLAFALGEVPAGCRSAQWQALRASDSQLRHKPVKGSCQ